MNLVLRRFANTEDGVFGKLYLPGLATMYTVEEDWRDNQRRVSCIPAGVYELVRTVYHKHGYETFEITRVDGRSRCLIHPANTEEDVEGCVGLGLRMGELAVNDEDLPGHPRMIKRAVLDSQAAFKRFMLYMTGINSAVLTVEWAPGVLND